MSLKRIEEILKLLRGTMEVIHERVETGCRELNEALLLPFFELSASIGRGWAHRIWANIGDRLTRDTDGPPGFSLAAES